LGLGKWVRTGVNKDERSGGFRERKSAEKKQQ
jgi:hypothetical protein